MNLKSNEGMQVFFDELAQLKKVKHTFMHKYNQKEVNISFDDLKKETIDM